MSRCVNGRSRISLHDLGNNNILESLHGTSRLLATPTQLGKGTPIAHTFGPHIRAIHLGRTFGPHIRATHLCHTFGPHIWATHLGHTFGPRIWAINLGHTFGPHIWATGLGKGTPISQSILNNALKKQSLHRPSARTPEGRAWTPRGVGENLVWPSYN